MRDNHVRDGAETGIEVVLAGGPETLHRDITIAGNTITRFGQAGIDLNRGNKPNIIEGLEISGNHIYLEAPPPNDLVGIRFQSDNTALWAEWALVAGNRIGTHIGTAVLRSKGVPYIVTSGNPTGAAFFEGEGPPDSIPGPAGSLFLRVDTDPAELHLKVNDTTWIPLVP